MKSPGSEAEVEGGALPVCLRTRVGWRDGGKRVVYQMRLSGGRWQMVSRETFFGELW